MSQKSVGSFSGTELERSSGWNSYDERGGMDGRVDQGQPPVLDSIRGGGNSWSEDGMRANF